MNKKNNQIIILNLIIFILVLLATLLMFLGIQFTKVDIALETNGIYLLKFFTVESNILMGITSLLIVITEFKKEKKKWIDRLNLISTTSVTLTFLTVVLYLAPCSNSGYLSFFYNSNFFFHLIVPILSIINFILNAKSENLTIKDALYALIPLILYSVFYITNAVINMENGKIIPKNDWYGFFANGIVAAIIIMIVLYLITYFASRLLIYSNKKYNEKK